MMNGLPWLDEVFMSERRCCMLLIKPEAGSHKQGFLGRAVWMVTWWCLMMWRMQIVSGSCITQPLNPLEWPGYGTFQTAVAMCSQLFWYIYCCNLSGRCLGNLCTLFQVDRIINSSVTNGLFQAACYFIIIFCTSVMDKLRAPVVCMSR